MNETKATKGLVVVVDPAALPALHAAQIAAAWRETVNCEGQRLWKLAGIAYVFGWNPQAQARWN